MRLKYIFGQRRLGVVNKWALACLYVIDPPVQRAHVNFGKRRLPSLVQYPMIALARSNHTGKGAAIITVFNGPQRMDEISVA